MKTCPKCGASLPFVRAIDFAPPPDDTGGPIAFTPIGAFIVGWCRCGQYVSMMGTLNRCASMSEAVQMVKNGAAELPEPDGGAHERH